MKKLTILTMAVLVTGLSIPVYADQDDYNNDREYYYRSDNTPEIEVWTNKGQGSRYYFGEDIAVYFRADEDCYTVIYDIDPSGEVNILFPSSFNGSSHVEGGRVYRVPDYDDDFRLEISGNSGDEHVFAVASYEYINPPDYMHYVGYDYGDDSYYDEDYFTIKVRGSLDTFVSNLNARICSGPFVVAHARFIIDTAYRHHRQYRYWDYDPYFVSSIWVGCDYPGSEIWIDGIFIGISPVLVPRAVVGYHWLWVYYGGYPCYQRYFYVPSYHRYNVDVRIDHRYHDPKFRRRSFHGWVFEEKKYRNEDGFRENAREIRQKNIRSRSLPESVVRDYADKGVISREAPIVKKIRTSEVERDNRRIDSNRDSNSRISRDSNNDNKGSRPRIVEPPKESGQDNGGKIQINRPERLDQPKEEGRIIVPERKPNTDDFKPSDGNGSGADKAPKSSVRIRESRQVEEKRESEYKEQGNEQKEPSQDRKIESNREEKRDSGEARQKEKSRSESGQSGSVSKREVKGNRSDGKAGKSDKNRGRGK